MRIFSSNELKDVEALVRSLFSIEGQFRFNNETGQCSISEIRISLIGADFDAKNFCMCHDCKNQRQKRCYVRVEDIIHQADFCLQHSVLYHGKKVDQIKWR